MFVDLATMTTKAGRFWLSVPSRVGDPRAQTRLSGDLIAGLGEGDGRLVIDGVGIHAADEAHFIDDFGRVGQQTR